MWNSLSVVRCPVLKLAKYCTLVRIKSIHRHSKTGSGWFRICQKKIMNFPVHFFTIYKLGEGHIPFPLLENDVWRTNFLTEHTQKWLTCHGRRDRATPKHCLLTVWSVGQGVACRSNDYVATVSLGCRLVSRSTHRPYPKDIWYWWQAPMLHSVLF